MNTNLLDLNADILNIIGDYVEKIMLIEWKNIEKKVLSKLIYYMIY